MTASMEETIKRVLPELTMIAARLRPTNAEQACRLWDTIEDLEAAIKGDRPRRKTPQSMYESLIDRLDQSIKTGPGCWEWNGYRNELGYGRVGYAKRLWLAHRVVYELLVEPIPRGLVLDHLCRNPACVRPDHLEAVTQQVNIERGLLPEARRSMPLRTHCSAGHPYDVEANVYVSSDGQRRCRVCNTANKARWRERNQSEVA